MAIIPSSVALTFEKAKAEVADLLAYDRSIQNDISVAEREVQEDTLRIAKEFCRLKPHTLPIGGQGGVAVPMDDLGKCGIEISADGRIFVLFAARVPSSQLITREAIEKDPALLQNFRERIPAFLQSYSQRYHGRLWELASEIKTLRDLGKVMVSYLNERG